MSTPGRWSQLPLRTSLLLGILGLTAAVLTAAAVVSAAALHADLSGRIDHQLRGAAGLLLARGRHLFDGTGPGQELRAVMAPTDYVVEVRDPAGAITLLSGARSTPTVPLLGQVRAATVDPVTVESGSGRFRVVVVQVAGATVLVGLPLAPVEETIRQLVLIEALSAIVLLTVLAVLARLLVVRRLRPLEDITTTATAISAGEFDRRITTVAGERAARTEVGRLTSAVNGMLARIQAALFARARSEERLQRFVADASHELRTPLTSVRGYLHLLAAGVVTERDRPDVLRRLDDETARMGAIVDDLLYLARLDAEPALRSQSVDLTAVVRDSVADAIAVEPHRRISLDVPDPCIVTGDEDSLRQVMANLLANVRAHTPIDAPSTVTLHNRLDEARVEVADSGPGLEPPARDRMFDRFYRGDPGRSASGGSGLGLAIVAEVIRTHGGDVAAQSNPRGGLTVWFRLPRTDT
ncbi:sensor histidine kinase [Amycolatopsis balhimycina DSM 5908]|uniref:histidine kinase n=1 Tax=Amycolatopsis balhimycina DSM 5908 TaxID=1081091 RepID=A0A428W053_AMYBA|nr:HAMP domain-containing sensor histidine kinase [Amycolatopsis balhimycina]RSM36455.1 sensor histidine kinase [Amycolatopsis balhimycina DSM 5908]